MKVVPPTLAEVLTAEQAYERAQRAKITFYDRRFNEVMLQIKQITDLGESFMRTHPIDKALVKKLRALGYKVIYNDEVHWTEIRWDNA